VLLSVKDLFQRYGLQQKSVKKFLLSRAEVANRRAVCHWTSILEFTCLVDDLTERPPGGLPCCGSFFDFLQTLDNPTV
jgi:hypothetical protein